jgi:predicted TIM-barrel fold metal-dependent hydrolase
VDSEADLRNRTWEEDNRRRVDELSGGKLAYVHIPDTAGGGYLNFNRYYFAQTDRQGAIIDERYNHGGAIADYIIDLIGRPLRSCATTREGEKWCSPMAQIYGPKTMIINEMAGSQRALNHGNLAPNHYWNKTTNTVDKASLLEQMEREINVYGISSWKWYCHTDPAQTGNGFQMDDDNSQWFIEESRKRGMKLISVHKGYSYQSRTLGHLANPKDVEKAALRNPDFNFVVYHSAIKHGSSEPNWKESNQYDPTTGDFLWHSVLMDIKKRNPQMKNVYCELGSFFNTLSVVDPVMAAHGLGKNIKYYGADHVVWGTDCLWWGSPQWGIDAFKRFQMPDEMCEKFGYTKLTKKDKAMIFGLNAAKLYKVDVKAKRKALPADTLERLKAAYVDRGGQRSNAVYGWVRADD